MLAMTIWYMPSLQSPLTALWRGSDPWGNLCSFLTGIQISSTVATAIIWRNPIRAWAWENAYEFLFLFQVYGSGRLDLYPFLDLTLLQDARLIIGIWSISLLVLGELSEIWLERRRGSPPCVSTGAHDVLSESSSLLDEKPLNEMNTG